MKKPSEKVENRNRGIELWLEERELWYRQLPQALSRHHEGYCSRAADSSDNKQDVGLFLGNLKSIAASNGTDSVDGSNDTVFRYFFNWNIALARIKVSQPSVHTQLGERKGGEERNVEKERAQREYKGGL
ncbi:unnamed protein product [Xylocopa violacea]|uniref:Uncharacterized protein n=1 Tax=Xylocopa violacea TaxID=135666 RepID=A0ABP1P2I8_XYLVO